MYRSKKNNIFGQKNQKKEISFVNKLYEKLLEEIFRELNKACNVNFSKRAWRIFIGPWLERFITISVENLKNKNLSKNKNNKFRNLITRNISELNENSQDLEWNKYLNYRLKKSKKFLAHEDRNYVSNITNLRMKLIFFFNKIFIKNLFSFFGFFNKILFYKPYLGKSFKTFKFFLILREIPLIYPIFEDKKYNYPYDYFLRKKIKISEKYSSTEEKLIKKILVESIPTFYLEGIPFLEKKLIDSPFPKKIKLIFTSSLLRDNLFKYLCFDYVNKGTKLIYKQHGSNYGQLEINNVEQHEIKISDYFITYGWNHKKPKVIPGCNFQNFSKKKIVRLNSNNILLLFGNSINFKRNNRIFNYDISYEFKCLKKLHKNFKNNRNYNFFYKIHPLDYKVKNFKKIISEKKFNKFRLIDNNFRLKNVYKNFKCVIFLYNSTEILNLIGKNLPIIICVNKNFINTLNSRARRIFIKLNKSGILYDDINKAMKHIEKQEDLDAWWNSKKVLLSRKLFSENYVNTSDKNMNNVVKIIKKSIKG